jgi:hypothetical protein
MGYDCFNMFDKFFIRIFIFLPFIITLMLGIGKLMRIHIQVQKYAYLLICKNKFP